MIKKLIVMPQFDKRISTIKQQENTPRVTHDQYSVILNNLKPNSDVQQKNTTLKLFTNPAAD